MELWLDTNTKILSLLHLSNATCAAISTNIYYVLYPHNYTVVLLNIIKTKDY